MKYIGNELEIFANAKNWKKYFSKKINPWINGKVLEVGAGIGETTKVLCKNNKWLCLEPDNNQYLEIEKKISSEYLPRNCIANKGTVKDLLNNNQYFDTILYIDVLEHIENDKKELEDASSILSPNGKIIILSPAHNKLFTPFDKAIGHYRRYNKKTLQKACHKNLKVLKCQYLDSVGLFASLANKLILSQKMPTKRQIYIWDSFMLPLSVMIDSLLFHKVGKSIFAVLQKDDKYI